MGFVVRTEVPEKMYEGLMIEYTVKPLRGIPMRWVTEIKTVRDNAFFVDEQRVGPYSIWHHQHHIIQQGNQVLMKDIVSYQPPFGFLGSIANQLIIKNKLNEIFEYRTKVFEKIFLK